MIDNSTVTLQPRGRDLRDMIVPPSILVCAIAVGVAAHLHAGLPFELAAATGMLLFSVGLVAHVLVGRAAAPPRRKKRRPEARVAPDAGADATTPAATEPVAPVWTGLSGEQLAEPAVARGAAAGDAPEPAPAMASPGVPPAWNLRPGDPELGAANVDAGAATAPDRPPALERRESSEPIPAEEAAEQERITTVLRRLASDLKTAGTPAAASATSAPDAAHVAEPAAVAAPTGEGKPGPSLSEAVDALRLTMDAMKSASLPRGSVETVAPPPPTEAEMRLAAVADALARERIEIFLEPIIGLSDETARHFEVTVRLRGAGNEILDPAVLATTQRGSEIVPLLDAVRVRHAAGIALKLERSGRQGSVFSEVAGPSLQSQRFVEGVAERQAQGIADRIVLTFLQNEVRGLGPAQLAALAELRDHGFRFALQSIADLDMDFELLRATGFEFVKLDADVFLDGLPMLGGRVPSSDICRHFAGLGMTVIVGGVDDEAVRARILGFGVLFGQGVLFGGPRPVRIADAGRPMHAAGAAA